MSKIKKNNCCVNVNVHCSTKSTRKKRKSKKKCKKKSSKRTLQISRCIPINKACDDTMPTPIFVGEKTSGISLPSGAITIVNTSETCTIQVAIEILSSMTPLITEIDPRSSFTTTLADIIRVDILCIGPMTENCTGTVQLDLVFTVSTKLDHHKVKHNLKRHSFYDTEIKSIKTNNRDRIEMLEPNTIGNMHLEGRRNIQIQEKSFSKEMSKIVDKLDHQLKNLDHTIKRRDELFLTALKEMSDNQKVLNSTLLKTVKQENVEEMVRENPKRIGGPTKEIQKELEENSNIYPKKIEANKESIESIKSEEKLKTEVSEASSIEKTTRNKKRKWWQKLFRISSVEKANG
ncbi:S-Ena type endospore appendage [Chengkuizengella sediminis]|uniref:S-Ena type endospore appendage n=1 Tax=Chengkuizengella sediminis TaxID=1885917 RepID=UPI00138A631F|nr:S-Ena type endospore appendage [Chengkuizengella sediminis]NDI33570.1 hypothetical protein [Chengkuizengella sediminis]